MDVHLQTKVLVHTCSKHASCWCFVEPSVTAFWERGLSTASIRHVPRLLCATVQITEQFNIISDPKIRIFWQAILLKFRRGNRSKSLKSTYEHTCTCTFWLYLQTCCKNQFNEKSQQSLIKIQQDFSRAREQKLKIWIYLACSKQKIYLIKVWPKS